MIFSLNVKVRFLDISDNSSILSLRAVIWRRSHIRAFQVRNVQFSWLWYRPRSCWVMILGDHEEKWKKKKTILIFIFIFIFHQIVEQKWNNTGNSILLKTSMLMLITAKLFKEYAINRQLDKRQKMWRQCVQTWVLLELKSNHLDG